MSDYGVYEDDMLNKRISDVEVERLLTGQVPEDPGLALLGSVLTTAHAIELVEPSEERVGLFASQAAAIARNGVGTKPDATPVRRRRALATIRERLEMVAVAMFVLVGMSGLAVAADAAAPGDPLYGIDRALERIGINDGAAGERLAEAGALASRGKVSEAIAHAASAIEEPSDEDDDSATSVSQAATALREAAVSVEGGNDEAASENVRVSVSAMLSELAELIGEPDLDGAEFGRRVSDMARSITGANDSNDESRPDRTDPAQDVGEGRPDDPGPPEDTPDGDPGGPPDDVPGGPPDDVPGGAPDGAGGSLGGGSTSTSPGAGPPPGSGRP